MDAAPRAFEDCVLGPSVSGQGGPLKKTRLLMLVMQVEKNNFGSSFLFWGVEHRCYSNGRLRCFFGGH